MMAGLQLLTIWFAAFICIFGEEVSSCEVTFTVRRGTTRRVSPGQCLRVECPLKHCRKLFNISWCKYYNEVNCETIPNIENVKITQKYVKDELISYLSFERVSINDDGKYQCDLGHSPESVSHSINISVSDQHKAVENPDNDAVGSNSLGEDVSWQHYFIIYGSIVLLVTTTIVLTFICIHSWKRTQNWKNKTQEEILTQMIPELPMTANLRTQFSGLNGIYSSSKAERTTSTSPSLAYTGNQTTVATAAKTRAPHSPVYAVINYHQYGIPTRKYICEQAEKTNYAVINVH